MIRLLIADDEALERETLADIVARRFEHEVTIETAENGRKAADTAVLWGADLILMDIEMPGMNGLDAARAVLEQRPECKVIFVTAYSLFQYAHEAMHLGACDYLLKPVNPDEVEASIRKAIRQATIANEMVPIVCGTSYKNKGVQEVLDAYDMMFQEKTRNEIDKMKLSFRDLMIVVQETVSLITGDVGTGEQ